MRIGAGAGAGEAIGVAGPGLKGVIGAGGVKTAGLTVILFGGKLGAGEGARSLGEPENLPTGLAPNLMNEQ